MRHKMRGYLKSVMAVTNSKLEGEGNIFDEIKLTASITPPPHRGLS